MPLILIAGSLFFKDFCIISVAVLGAFTAPNMNKAAAAAAVSWLYSNSNSHAIGNDSTKLSSPITAAPFINVDIGA